MNAPALTPEQRTRAAKLLASKVATQLADLLVNPKTTLTWLMHTVGAPPVLTSLLVPLRESGSMLPQLWLAPWISRSPSRIRAAMLGAAGQSALYAALGTTLWLAQIEAWMGGLIVVTVALASLMRAVSSIANKDVLARAVPKGARGRIGGLATSTAGAIGLLAAGGAAVASLAATTSVYVAVVLAASAGFAIATALLASLPEPAAEPEPASKPAALRTMGLGLLRTDPVFRRFVGIRALLSATALCAPYIVLLATRRGEDQLQTLAAFVAASGLAAALSGWVWGRVADRSARRSMEMGAAIATMCIIAALVLDADGRSPPLLWPMLYFAFSVGYAGIRVGRKTYVVDIATGELRTHYVAASNTLLALVLLILGAAAGVVHSMGASVALAALGSIGALGGGLVRLLPATTSAPSGGAPATKAGENPDQPTTANRGKQHP